MHLEKFIKSQDLNLFNFSCICKIMKSKVLQNTFDKVPQQNFLCPIWSKNNILMIEILIGV